jgi:beta-lactamase regulating signal transducer with metallopeptidase domain
MSEWPTHIELVARVWADAMIRACWQGGIALALAWAICRCLPRLPPWARCWLWRLAYLKFFVALCWVTPVELPLLPAREPAAPKAVAQWREPVAPPGGGGAAASPGARTPPALVPPAAGSSLPVAPVVWLLLAWCVGISVGGVRLFRQWWQARLVRARATLMDVVYITRLVAAAGELTGLRKTPEILASSEIPGPELVGLLRPVVVLPTALIGSSTPAQLMLMLTHELAHLRRRDLWWNWLPAATRAFFFFHPFVWLAEREWTLAQEVACDEHVLRVTHAEEGEYGRLLLKLVVACVRPVGPNPVTAGAAGSFNVLKRRLIAMKSYRSKSQQWPVVTALVITVLGFAAVVPWRLTAAEGDAPPSLDQLKAGLKSRRDAVKSIRVEYTLETKAHVDPPRLLSQWGIVDGLVQEDRTDAFKEDKQYHRFKTRKGTKSFADDTGARINPGVEYARTEDARWQVQPDNGIYVRYPERDLNWFGAQTMGWGPWLYFQSVGIAPPDLTMTARERRTRFWLLPDLLDLSPYRVVRQEAVDGARCVVLESAVKEWPWCSVPPHWKGTVVTDRLWLDLDHGLALRRREFRSGDRILGAFVNSEMKEAVPGLWLPTHCEFLAWPPPTAAEEHQGHPAVIVKLTVKDLAVNDVKDEIFSIPAGAVTDVIRD